MARIQTDKTDKAPAAKRDDGRGEALGSELKWEPYLIAEDEITRREGRRAKIETSEQMQWAAKDSARDDFWPTIRDYADECDEILAEHGFPPASVLIAHDGASQWWFLCDANGQLKPAEEWRFAVLGAHFTKMQAPDFSDAWYAAEVGLKCRLALAALPGAAGRPDHYVALFEIASLRTEWLWRRKHKAYILTGRKQRKVLSAHRAEAYARRKSVTEARRAAIAEMLNDTGLKAGALERYLKKRLAYDYEISASLRTIRRDLKGIRGD